MPKRTTVGDGQSERDKSRYCCRYRCRHYHHYHPMGLYVHTCIHTIPKYIAGAVREEGERRRSCAAAERAPLPVALLTNKRVLLTIHILAPPIAAALGVSAQRLTETPTSLAPAAEKQYPQGSPRHAACMCMYVYAYVRGHIICMYRGSYMSCVHITHIRTYRPGSVRDRGSKYHARSGAREVPPSLYRLPCPGLARFARRATAHDPWTIRAHPTHVHHLTLPIDA